MANLTMLLNDWSDIFGKRNGSACSAVSLCLSSRDGGNRQHCYQQRKNGSNEAKVFGLQDGLHLSTPAAKLSKSTAAISSGKDLPTVQHQPLSMSSGLTASAERVLIAEGGKVQAPLSGTG